MYAKAGELEKLVAEGKDIHGAEVQARFFADKVLGVFLAEPVADILAASTTGILFFWRFPKILEHRRQELAQINRS